MSLFKALINKLQLFFIGSILIFGFNALAIEKPASIVEVDTFGSEGYKLLEKIDKNLVAVTTPNSRLGEFGKYVDVFRIEQDKLIKTDSVDFETINDDFSNPAVRDMAKINEKLIFYVELGYRACLVIASIDNDKFVFDDFFNINLSLRDAKLHLGNNDNFYLSAVVDGELRIEHFQFADGQVVSKSSTLIAHTTDKQTSYGDFYKLDFTEDYLLAVIFDPDGQASFIKTALTESGALGEIEPMVFAGAKDQYWNIKLDGTKAYLFPLYRGIQVVNISANKLELLFEDLETNYTPTGYTQILNETLIGTDHYQLTFFDIKNPESPYLLNNYDYSFWQSEDFVIDGDRLYIARKESGLQVVDIADYSNPKVLYSYTQSSIVTDFAVRNGKLATGSAYAPVSLWDISNPKETTLSYQFTKQNFINMSASDLNSFKGLEFIDDERLLLVSDNAQGFNVKIPGNDNDLVNDWFSIFNQYASSSIGEVISLSNGYVLLANDDLYFFDQYNAYAHVKVIESHIWDVVNTPVAHNNKLFVQVFGHIEVYDTSNLTDVYKITTIELDSYSYRGNLAVKSNYLFTLELGQIAVFDISDLNDVKRVSTIDINSLRYGVSGKAIYVEGNYLVAFGKGALLFDISEPSEPILIDENMGLSTNGTGIGMQGQFFNVLAYTGGTVQRTALNYAPVVNTDKFEVTEDEVLPVIQLFSDPEGDDVTITIIDGASNGVVTVTPELRYQPNENYNGEDSFIIKLEDIYGNNIEKEIIVSVLSVDDIPVAESLTATVNHNSAYTRSLATTDVDGDNLQYSLLNDATNGAVSLSANGSFTYTPNNGYSGSDSFTYEVSDGKNSSQGTITLSVQAAPVVDTKENSSNGGGSGGGSMGYILLMLCIGLLRFQRQRELLF
ncbi:hypothetical protein tinsulaeT_30720 [Thalassotalea insulae]|uniref:Tandem-95 repeat protein n=1 Tax=Thalassotalea insulae TaxID=2056778 RepID=A0ABQ6GWJ0_9GAMM|nr:Ig-like domain-containing protein [Thalassotalea insulae]GLX79732.1 hypothetical protein tinsulaeT_30720 [Thalassotalea insulae]